MSGKAYVGIGGWTYEPWRDNFYPKGLAQARELEFASRAVTAIEINGTYYGSQKPETFAKWAEAVPDGFIFAVKASRFVTNRKRLGEGAESVAKFLNQGIARLGDKLGPILWQFRPTKQFDAEDFEAFLKLLPPELDGLKLRHALEVRHETFVCPEFVDLARSYGAAIVFADHVKHPMIADLTADFVYARLQDAAADIPTGYNSAALDRWAGVVEAWNDGEDRTDLPHASTKLAEKRARDVFLFMINGAKERAPAAAKALIERL